MKLGGASAQDAESEEIWFKEGLKVSSHVTHEEKAKYPEVVVTDEEFLEWCKPWRGALVVKVLGKRVNYKILENKVHKEWAKKGKVKIVDMPHGYYLVQLSDPNDYQHALFEGPWRVADHYILVQRWRPGFLQNAEFERHVAVWVRIPDLPIELFNEQFLKRVGEKLGVMLKIDKVTSLQARGQFTRICVELDLTKPLMPKFIARGIVLSLGYEGLHLICFRCGKYGHKENACMEGTGKPVEGTEKPKEAGVMEKETQAQSMQTRADVSMAEKNPDDSTVVVKEGDSKKSEPLDYGPWMIAKNRNKSKNKGKGTVSTDQAKNHSKGGRQRQEGRYDRRKWSERWQ